ncbi:MAG TPA: hypothetical protein VN207_04920, partial [Ktedonobacteraceae bacterium]|nr:hypothetical protein [Ktedonobacteraceae bacterium]
MRTWIGACGSIKSLLQRGLKGILPLVPLTEDGQDHDAIEYVIKELRQPGVKQAEELLSLTYGLAGLVFEQESEHDWLQRRFAMIDDVIEESWTFQEKKQKWQKETQRQNLLLLIKTHFSSLLQLAQDVSNAIQTLEELQDLFR